MNTQSINRKRPYGSKSALTLQWESSRLQKTAYAFAVAMFLCLLSQRAFAAPPILPSGLAGEATNASQTAPSETVSSQEETTTFKVKVNLVEVRVVVRDAHGRAVSGLKQQDFQLLDNGKPQLISKFSAEQAGAIPAFPQQPSTQAAGGAPSQPPAATVPGVPQHYVAYLFDDVHLSTSEISLARKAAEHQLQSLQPTDRAGIYTTSGQNQLDFTDDRAQLTAALNRLMPRPQAKTAVTPCPNISYYVANLILNTRDDQALAMATQDALDCAFMSDPQMMSEAEQMAKSTALQEFNRGGEETRLALGGLRNLVHRIAAMPGQRTIILVSPGFINYDALQEQTDLMERALHSNVIINALDARGLYTDMPEANDTRPSGYKATGTMQQFRTAELAADADVMVDLAVTTGGTFFHNNNDLEEGFGRLASAPEFSYLLGFSPQNLKSDGHYHKLKVELNSPARGAIQARKGYYAPRAATDPAEQARQAIDDAVFSQEESREIPVELRTQFFKPDDSSAKLSVLVQMDVRHVHFRKVNGRNDNDVTIVSAVFDRNGNFVSGNQKVLQLRLKDENLEARLNSGVNLKTSFDVKPGNYVVRVVVRDEDGQLSAQNSAIEIP